MELKPGSRWRSAVCETELVVVRPPRTAVVLECGGRPVISHTTPRPEVAGPSPAFAGGSVAGKRYIDPETGVELLCTKAGAGALGLEGRVIQAAEAKKLPSSD